MSTQRDPDAATAPSPRSAPTLQQTGLEVLRRRLRDAPAQPSPVMHRIEDLRIDGPHGRLLIRHYRPTAAAVLPALVYFHGGGMAMGSAADFDAIAQHLAARAEVAVLSVDYRLAPEHVYPVAHDEGWAAVRWIAGNAARLGVDPARLGVVGDSAGGGLAAAMALRDRNEQAGMLALQVLLYPGLERRLDRPSARETAGVGLTAGDVAWLKNLYLGTDESLDTEYGVPGIAADVSGLAPAIIATAEMDVIRDGAEHYAERLRAAGNPVALVRYPAVHHGFLSRPAQSRTARDAFRDIGALVRARFSADTTD